MRHTYRVNSNNLAGCKNDQTSKNMIKKWLN